MVNQGLGLLGVKIDSLLCYFLWAIGLSIAVRVILCLIKAYEATIQGKRTKFLTAFGRGLIGFSPTPGKNDQKGDYLAPFIVGLLEFMSFPVLIFASHWSYLGWWLAFKTAAQYAHWTKDRTMFNRYLIGTALVLILSVIFLVPMVSKMALPCAHHITTDTGDGGRPLSP